MSKNIFETFECSKHGEYQGKKIPRFFSKTGDGKEFIDPICPKCDRDRREKKEIEYNLERARTRQTFVEKQIGIAGISKRFMGKDFENYSVNYPKQSHVLKIAKRYAKSLKERVSNGDCLVFCGGPGTGKSHLASAIVQSAIKGSMTAIYLTITDIVLMARSTYNHRAERTLKDEMAAINDLDLLVIDEIGQQVGREDQWILFHIIDTRYRMKKPVILISNLNVSELTEYLGERVVDRVCEGLGMIIPFNWPSHRKNGKK